MENVVITEEIEKSDSINVQIKLYGVDLDQVKSTDKVFHVGGREYPMTRFGSWVMKEIRDTEAIAKLIHDGGVVVAVTWAFAQAYSEVIVWVKSIQDGQFSLEMTKSLKERLMDDITTGQLSKQLETCLEGLNGVGSFSGVRVNVEVVESSDSAKKSYVNDVRNRFPEAVRLNRLAAMERVANLMKRGEYMQAYTMLKSNLEREKEAVHRLQMALRLSVCALHLNKEEDWKSAVTETQNLMKIVEIPAEEVSSYQKEYDKLFSLLLVKRSAVLAIEVSYAFMEIAKNLPGPVERLDNMSMILNKINKAMKILMSVDPCACLKTEHLRNIEKMAEQIEFMQTQTECDPLVKAQCIYYAEYAAAEMRIAIDKQKESVFRSSSMEFKRLSSCWADLPFVVTRLRRHPEVRKFLEDDEFCVKVQQISKNPSLLQQHLKDSKIVKANDVLMSEFGIFSSNQDIIETMNTTGLVKEPPGTYRGATTSPETGQPLDKKQEAQLEKEKGNEAYKNLDFMKAHSHYDRALSLNPDDAMLHSNKAAVFMSQGNLGMARLACLKAISMVQGHDKVDLAKITARLARVEHLDKDLERAFALYKKSLELNFDPKVEEHRKECETAILASRFMGSPFAQ